jgi:hypothetical protein
MVISSFQQYDAPPDSNLAPKTPKKNNNNKIKPKIKNKIKKALKKKGGKKPSSDGKAEWSAINVQGTLNVQLCIYLFCDYGMNSFQLSDFSIDR